MSKVVSEGCGDPLPYSLCLKVLAGSSLLRFSSLYHAALLQMVVTWLWLLQKHPFLSFFPSLQLLGTSWASCRGSPAQ